MSFTGTNLIFSTLSPHVHAHFRASAQLCARIVRALASGARTRPEGGEEVACGMRTAKSPAATAERPGVRDSSGDSDGVPAEDKRTPAGGEYRRRGAFSSSTARLCAESGDIGESAEGREGRKS